MRKLMRPRDKTEQPTEQPTQPDLLTVDDDVDDLMMWFKALRQIDIDEPPRS